ncbi:hypothetical protein CLCAR_2664 [Clostridium carboxidivorans P7]|nr:hypothetical protein CLCAR_2664 [Clostridium carboxidivorans P7]
MAIFSRYCSINFIKMDNYFKIIVSQSNFHKLFLIKFIVK